MSNTNQAMFYNSYNGDRKYDADDMTDWLKPFFTTGVFNGQLQVTANNDMTVSVAPGYVNIGGKVKHFVRSTTIELETSSATLDRIDNIVARRDDTNRDIYLTYVKGGSASSPVAPDVNRSGAIYELKIAEVYVAAGAVRITQAQITDTRMNADVCGWVASTVKELDFSQITAQFNEFFSQYKAAIISQYNAYLVSIGDTEEAARQAYNDFRGRLDTLYSTYREYLLAEYAAFLGEIEQKETDAQTAYNTMKDKMDGLFDDYEEDTLTRFQAFVSSLSETETDAEADYQALTANLSALLLQYQTAFDTWFDNMKGQLSTDAAGHLQNQVDDLKDGQQGSGEDITNLRAVFEQYTLQNRAIINSLSFNQLAVFMELQAMNAAAVAGMGDNVIVEMFDEPADVLKGYYDAINKRAFA